MNNKNNQAGLRSAGIVVFWLDDGIPQAAPFPGTDISAALRYSQELRRLGEEGAPIAHVTLSTALPGNVTRAGVSDAADDYDWTKRRGGRRP